MQLVATAPSPTISGDSALTIAQRDAVRVYGDLSFYRIQLSLEPDGWRIDYDLKKPHSKGGGPHYLIDASSGDIISNRYEQ